MCLPKSVLKVWKLTPQLTIWTLLEKEKQLLGFNALYKFNWKILSPKLKAKRLIHILFNNIKMSIYWSIFVLKLVYFDF